MPPNVDIPSSLKELQKKKRNMTLMYVFPTQSITVSSLNKNDAHMDKFCHFTKFCQI